MSIRPLSRMDEEKAKEVWKVCFGDSDAFIREYFDKIVRYENTLGYYDGDSLIADLFMLEFQAKLAGGTYGTDFLAGCATLPAARKRGLMRELVRNAMLTMRKRGLIVTYLHPFLHAFYRRFGYETVAYVKRASMSPKPGRKKAGTTVYAGAGGAIEGRMHQAYNRYIAHYDNAFVRSWERFSQWLSLLFADRGYAILTEEGEKDLAYALYYLEEDIAEVFELVCADEKEREKLLDSIPAKTVNYFLPSLAGKDGEAEEFTMMRVLDPVSLLQGIPVKESRFILEIEDDFFGEHYNLCIEKRTDGKNKVKETEAAADVFLSIGELAQAAAGAFPPDSKCKDYFFGQTACFFETY